MPSDLERKIPPQIIGDDFYSLIMKVASRPDIHTILEIGASAGEGSTEAFVTGMRTNPSSPVLYCLEISHARFSELSTKFADSPAVRCYNASSVPERSFASEDEVLDFWLKRTSKFSAFPLPLVLSWLSQDKAYLKSSGVADNGIREIMEQNKIAQFDVVLIDGSEFTGKAELDLIYGARIVFLDDIDTFKNYENFRRLSFDPIYELKHENHTLRNGFAMFEKLKIQN